MSKEALGRVVQRAISDAAFRRQLATDPTGALRGFELTSDEATAIRSGDAGRLSALGVDQRMSKAFTLGGGAETASKLGGTDITGTYGSAITTGDMGTPGGDAVSNALVTGGDNTHDALIGGTDEGQVTPGSFTTGSESVYGNTLTAGDDGSATVIPSDGAQASDALTNDPAHSFGAATGGGDPMLGNTLTAGDETTETVYPNDPRLSSHFIDNDSASDLYPSDPRLTGHLVTGDASTADMYPNDPHLTSGLVTDDASNAVHGDGGASGASMPGEGTHPDLSQ